MLFTFPGDGRIAALASTRARVSALQIWNWKIGKLEDW